jgi:hypothetical protein
MPNEILPLRRTPDPDLPRIPGRQDQRRRRTVSYGTQAHRLGETLDKSFFDILDRDDIDVADDASSLAPERALVLEVIGSPKNFVNAAKRVGMEWLAEEVAILHGVHEYFDPDRDDEEEPDGEDEDALTEEDFDFLLGNEEEVADRDDETLGTLYLGMPTVATFERLRELWDLYKSGAPQPDKHSDWWGLFSLLHRMRPWGPQDRIAEATRRRLREERDRAPAELNVEVDLWYRGDADRRARAVADFKVAVEEVGGTVLDELRIDEIRYHAALVHLPVAAVDAIVERTGPLAFDDDVMSIRPQSSFKFNIEDILPVPAGEDEDDGDVDEAPAIGALIDGWPVENHRMLRNRLDVIELDVADSLAPLNKRVHGTAMASLILRGDLHEGNPPLRRRLKVVPVLVPEATAEMPPKNKLALGLVHRAVVELKEGHGGHGPSGRDVIIINHSICDEAFGFAGIVSPWARLLDYLAWKYKVLFVVSAGNIRDTFELPAYPTGAAMRAATQEHRREATLKAIDAVKSQRTMFAPAEAVNSLTVAAAHKDGSEELLPANLADPFGDFSAPNLMSGLGHGFNRSVKPDVMLPGGRQVAHPTEGPTLRVHGMEHPNVFGQKVASPDPFSGNLNMTRRSSGTSNAAALATRSGLLIGDVLDSSPLGPDPWYRRPTAACILKALIAHGAAWRECGKEMTGFYTDAGSAGRRKEAVSRSMGYGEIDIARIVGAGGHRVTLLGDDEIRTGKRHEWRIPLPDELRASAEFRRIVVTLAWLSPVQANSSSYRAIGLELVGEDGKSQLWEGVKRVPSQPSVAFAKRGTLIHAVYESKSKAIPFGEDGDFVVNVQAAVPKLPGLTRIDVPYALAVTIEVADTISADISQSIRRRITPQVRTSR